MHGSSKSDFNGLSAIVLVSQVGLSIVIPIVLGVLIGRHLDSLLGGHGLILAGIILLSVVFGICGAAVLILRESTWKHSDDSD